MKKVLLSFVVLSALSASAQSKGDVEFGVNVGYNSSVVAIEGLTSDPGSGINVGFSADYYFSDRWSIKGKLIYDQKGFNNGFYFDSFDPADSFEETDFNLNYLTVPVMANWHFAKKRNWYLNFGPYAGFLLSAKETEGGNDVKEAFSSTDFGLALGIGVKIPLSEKLKLSLEYEEQFGLSNISADGDDGAATNSRGAFNIGLNFMLK
ncbi:MAG TPA: porin family protein [Flavobacterium sp.]|jgi:opacity protein-like surface antigen